MTDIDLMFYDRDVPWELPTVKPIGLMTKVVHPPASGGQATGRPPEDDASRSALSQPADHGNREPAPESCIFCLAEPRLPHHYLGSSCQEHANRLKQRGMT